MTIFINNQNLTKNHHLTKNEISKMTEIDQNDRNWLFRHRLPNQGVNFTMILFNKIS